MRMEFKGARAVIVGEIWKVTTSCGFAIPKVRLEAPRNTPAPAPAPAPTHTSTSTSPSTPPPEIELSAFEERDTLDRFLNQQLEKGIMVDYQRKHNSRSLDGLPALKAARRDNGETLFWGDVGAKLNNVRHEKLAVGVGFLLAVLVFAVGRTLDVLF